MSVAGFDIGNENCVIAVVKKGGIDVLLNDESKRETPAVVFFGEKQRLLGSAGAASAIMNPKSTISQVKRLIGRRFNDPGIQNDLKLLSFETSEASDGGILIHLRYLGETHTFTPVQIMAMLFAHLKDITEKNLEEPISDCVISIPSYFSDMQRRAYLNAAAIAGLKSLRLMHDCTATALTYGIYKTDYSTTGISYAAFVDIGHCDTQVCIVSFAAGHMKVLSHTFDGNLGGRDFDEILVSYFASKFQEQYNIDVNSNLKASIRLRSACEKVKKVLSANLEAPLNIECLMDERDVKGLIKREEFEKLASGLLERISFPCNRALADAGLTAEKIHAVELVGSGSRIPAISSLLTTLFKREPSRTLNASECVARGCALQCAMLSPIFRVRDYEVEDSIPFSIGFTSDGGPISIGSNGILFPKGQSIPCSKVLSFQRGPLFHLEAYYADQGELPAEMPSKICYYKVGPLQGYHNEKTTIKVRVQLNLHGIVAVDSATLIEDIEEDSECNSFSGNFEIDAADGDESNIGQSKVLPSSNRKVLQVNAMKKGKMTKRIAIPISEHIYGGMTHAELSEAQERELLLAQQDKTIEQTKNKKNALESYVYEMRNKLFNTYRNFANEEERQGISTSLQETVAWLYEDGDDETETTYTSKLENLKKLVDPIEDRYRDEEARVEAANALSKCILEYRRAADSLPHKDKEMIMEECDKAERWLSERITQQDLMPKNTDPVLWSSDIKCREENLDGTCKHILMSIDSPAHSED